MPSFFREPVFTAMRAFIKYVVMKTKSYGKIMNEPYAFVFPDQITPKRRTLAVGGESGRNKRILYVYHQNFLKDNTGANSYALQIAKKLKNSGCSIDFLSMDDFCDDFHDFDDDNKKHGGIVDNLYLYLHARGAKKKREKYTYPPLSCVYDAFIEYFQQVAAKNRYHAICVHSTIIMDLVKFSDIKPRPKIVGVLDELYSMHSFNWSKKSMPMRMSALGRNIATEIEWMKWCDDILCISADEKRFFEKFHTDNHVVFHFLPYFVAPKKLQGGPKEIDCLFVGNANPYNRDSVAWIIEEVLPLLKPGVRFAICGKVCGMLKDKNPELYEKALRYGMKMLDFVDNLDEMHAKSRISLAPTLAGAGLKIKVINSMACGVPVVATDLGIDGFPDRTENGCVIANTPAEFAGAITRLLTDETFYADAAGRCNSYFERHFSYDRNSRLIDRIFFLD